MVIKVRLQNKTREILDILRILSVFNVVSTSALKIRPTTYQSRTGEKYLFICYIRFRIVYCSWAVFSKVGPDREKRKFSKL